MPRLLPFGLSRRQFLQPRWARLRLEELEIRSLLSAGPVAVPLSVVPLQHWGGANPVVNNPSPSPTALTPAQVQQAYGFNAATVVNPTTGQALTGAGQTIAIVDAYNDPNIQNDLHTFDQKFGLNDPTLTVVNQKGGSTLPATDPGWALEISLDVEWAHAIAPGANILLVEANSATISDLFGAVSYASSQPGVAAVSMSWGTNEFVGETSLDHTFANHPGVVFVASSGDSFSSSYPAASPYVLSVGGTTLSTPTNSGAASTTEVAWDLSGGGLSLARVGWFTYTVLESEPAYQKGVQSTGVRVSPDVAFNADPSTGFAVYDSLAFQNVSGWQKIGGTSAGAPQWAALVALADEGRQALGAKPLDGPTQLLPALYSLSSSNFNTIKTDDSGTLVFTGYNAYTGLGSPAANQLIPSLIGVGLSQPLASAQGSFATGTRVFVSPFFGSDPNGLNESLASNAGANNFLNGNNALLTQVLTVGTPSTVTILSINRPIPLAFFQNAQPPLLTTRIPAIYHVRWRGRLIETNAVTPLRWLAWYSGASGEEEPVQPAEPVPGAEPPPTPVPDAILPAAPESFDDPDAPLNACFADEQWRHETISTVRAGIALAMYDSEEIATESALALMALALLNPPCSAAETRTERGKKRPLELV